MAVKRDYYEVLGVGKQASPDELKRAFRKIAMESHPDRNPDDAMAHTRFKEASESSTPFSGADSAAVGAASAPTEATTFAST